VDVWIEILEGVPLFVEGEAVSGGFKAGKFLVDHFVRGDLLCAVDDELAANEANIRVCILAVVCVAVWSLFRFIRGVKGIAGGIKSNEALAVLHVVEQRLFSSRGHGWLLVFSLGS
jgi:hypothetical protein